MHTDLLLTYCSYNNGITVAPNVLTFRHIVKNTLYDNIATTYIVYLLDYSKLYTTR